MARLKKGAFGAVGPVVFYEFRGQPVMRSKPTRVRQTKATKAAAQDFGKAAGWSRRMRSELHLLTRYYKDIALMYRLNNALLQWLRDSKSDKKLAEENIKALTGLQLNEQCPFSHRLKIKPVVHFDEGGNIMVEMPAITPATDIKAPPSTGKIEIGLVAVRCNTIEVNRHKSEPPSHYQTAIEMSYSNKSIAAQTIDMPLETIPGDIVLLFMGINFWEMHGRNAVMVGDGKWVNGVVVGCWYKE